MNPAYGIIDLEELEQMSENLYNKILGVNAEVYNPDYYQMLLIHPDDVTPELIEKQYKVQMSKVQNVRSTKYKDFIEFLKGELKQARRILNDPRLRQRYEERRRKESSDKLSEIVEMFIQISGNLSEIEIREIHRQGNHLNLVKREIDRIIDDNLQALGCKRMKATPDQLKRASDILKRRANKGIVSESQLLYLTENGEYTSQKPDSDNNVAVNGSDEKKLEQMKKDAEKLNQLADRQVKYKPYIVTLKIVNILFNIAGWVLVFGLIIMILFMKDNASVQNTVIDMFNVKPKIETKIIHEGKPIDTDAKVKNEFEEFQEMLVNPEPGTDFKSHMEKSRNLLLEICERLKDSEDQELYKKSLNFYSDFIAPSYYNTQSRWDWQMFTKPFDFKSHADFFAENFAEFSSQDVDKGIAFGGNFTCGIIEIVGSVTESSCNFGFDLQSESKKDHMRCRIFKDSQGAFFIESRHIGLDDSVGSATKTKKIDTEFPVSSFDLQLDARTPMNKDQGRIILLNYTLKITDINGNEILTTLWDEIKYVSEESSQISLFIGKDSKVRIRRISVEPFN